MFLSFYLLWHIVAICQGGGASGALGVAMARKHVRFVSPAHEF